jgi:hypothetical protein
MEEVLTMQRDEQTRVVVYTRYSATWIEQYVLREDGTRETLLLMRNPWGQVPWFKVKIPDQDERY